MFIITHNSNTGILTDPQTTTVCSFRTNDIQNSYRQSNLTDKLEIIEDEVVNENASAHYLEGGIQALEERHSILVNKKEMMKIMYKLLFKKAKKIIMLI